MTSYLLGIVLHMNLRKSIFSKSKNLGFYKTRLGTPIDFFMIRGEWALLKDVLHKKGGGGQRSMTSFVKNPLC